MIDKKYYDEFDYYGDVAAFTACAVSSPPKQSLALARTFLDECAFSFGEIVFESYEQKRASVRQDIARMIGADAHEIAFTMNTTEGNNMLPVGLGLKPGDSVVVTDMEYAGTIIPWIQKQSDGIRLNIVKSVNGCVRTEDVCHAIDDATKVVFLSWVQSASGHRLDVENIGKVCHEKHIWFGIDAIQGLGRNVIDVKKWNVDFLTAAGFKGLLGTLGAGFVYCSKELLAFLPPMGYGEENLAAPYNEESIYCGQPLPLRADAMKLEYGSLNTYGIMVMGKSIELLLEIGIEEIQKEVRQLEAYYRSEIKASGLDISFLGDEDEKYWSGNVSILFAFEKTAAVEAKFKEDKIFATIKNGYVRIGIHFYNTREQLSRVVNALRSAI